MGESKQTLLDLLEKIAKEHKYVGHTIDVDEISSNGANLTSALYRATLRVDGKPDLKVFAKVALMSDHVRKMTPMKCPFTTELYFYTKLQKEYARIEEKYNVPEEHKIHMPKLYASRDEYLSETLVVDDLIAIGFRNFDRRKTADLEYVTTAVGLMAKFHALSLAFHHDEPDSFRHASSFLKMDVAKMEVVFSLMKAKINTTALDAVADEHREKLNKYISQDPWPAMQLLNTYRRQNKNIIVHGDFKPSNLMHRQQNGQLEIVPVDFQLVCDGDPTRDLLYFIFTATDEALRREHYHAMLDLYHKRLREALARLQIDVEDVYSKSTYKGLIEEYSMMGLILAVVVLPVVLAEEEKVPTLDSEFEMTDFVVEGGRLYKERLNGIVNNYVEWGLL